MEEFGHRGYFGERQTLLRIEDLLKEIVNNKQHKHSRRVDMSVTLTPGQSVTETATAYQADGVTPDPNGVISWSDTAASGLGTITDNGTVAGVSTATVSNPAGSTATGTMTLLATNADPDKATADTGTNNPSTITFAAGTVNTDATTVNIVDGTPA